MPVYILSFSKKLKLSYIFCFLGTAVCEGKPNMSELFRPIVAQLKKLEFGINIDIENQLQMFKFYTLIGSFDKQAKASVLNIVNSNGYHSCLKFTQRGIFVNYGIGNHHIFLFDPNNPKDVSRNVYNY